MWIAEADDTDATDERHRGIRAFAAAHDGASSIEDMLRREFLRALLAECKRENIQEDFGVRACIEVSKILLFDFLGELRGVREVSIVRERHAEWRVDEERLGFEFTATTCSRIANVTDAHRTPETFEGVSVEDFAHHARRFLEVELVVVGDDTCRVLASVLEDDESVVQILNDIAVTGDGEDSTHKGNSYDKARLS